MKPLKKLCFLFSQPPDYVTSAVKISMRTDTRDPTAKYEAYNEDMAMVTFFFSKPVCVELISVPSVRSLTSVQSDLGLMMGKG
jgi:hypothetical protein